MANLYKSKYLLRNLVIKQKIPHKNCANCNKLYIFEKTLDPASSNMQKPLQNF